MIAVRMQHADPQLAIALELAERQAQPFPQRKVERVALGRPIETDRQDVAVAFEADPANRHHTKVRQPGAFR